MASATGGPARPLPPAQQDCTASAREPAQGRPHPSIAAADLAQLAIQPLRLVGMVDPERGVTVLRALSCEQEEEIDTVRHACGAEVSQALTPLLSSLSEQVRKSIVYPGEAGITCHEIPENTCEVAPHSECEPTYYLVFKEGWLVTIVERDDWQASEEVRQSLDTRIHDVLSSPPNCGE